MQLKKMPKKSFGCLEKQWTGKGKWAGKGQGKVGPCGSWERQSGGERQSVGRPVGRSLEVGLEEGRVAGLLGDVLVEGLDERVVPQRLPPELWGTTQGDHGTTDYTNDQNDQMTSRLSEMKMGNSRWRGGR